MTKLSHISSSLFVFVCLDKVMHDRECGLYVAAGLFWSFGGEKEILVSFLLLLLCYKTNYKSLLLLLFICFF